MRSIYRVGIVALLVVTFAYTPSASAQSNKGVSDLKKLQGRWLFVYYDSEGRVYPPAKVRAAGTTLTIKGKTLSFLDVKGNLSKGSLRIKPRKRPKHIDTINSKGAVERGIYKVSGKIFQFCFSHVGLKTRPKRFKGSKKARISCMKFERL
jgi:uncharacterized protein (TIGR03067 family)